MSAILARALTLGLLAASLILTAGCGWKVASRTLAFKKGSLELDGKKLVSTDI